MHVTHYKAGSQWILEILKRCAGDRIVQPISGSNHFLGQRIEEGLIYPTLYVTREQFEAADLPGRWRRFVVIRDPRDSLVSAFFSLKFSHSTDGFPEVARRRGVLSSMDKEEGLLWLTARWVGRVASVQASWREAGVEPIRYEDLLERDVEILDRVLIDDCELPVSRGRLRRAVEAARFQRLSGGRHPGEEDPASHWRKGIAGDWRQHFTEPVKDAFKELWGDELVAAGYERDHDW